MLQGDEMRMGAKPGRGASAAGTLLLGLALCACGGTESRSLPVAAGAVDAILVPTWRLSEAAAQSAAGPSQEAAVCLAKQAGIDFLRAGGVGARDLTQLLRGQESQLEYDLDADGKAELVYAFSPAADPDTYLSWRMGSTCSLAWGSKGYYWQVSAPCHAEVDAVVCMLNQADQSASCDRCGPGGCHSCQTDGAEVHCQ